MKPGVTVPAIAAGLDRKTLAKLDAYAVRQGISRAEAVRQAVTAFLKALEGSR